jgi:hypothetical protein
MELLGATVWLRKTIESDIFYWKPDKWFKIWFFLINKVNHKDTKLFKRGSNFTTYQEIALYTKATKHQIDQFIRWAKEQQMLTTQKTTRGMIVFIVKYNEYQDYIKSKNDTGDETKTKQKRNINDTINNNDNNVNNVNNIRLDKPTRKELTFKKEEYDLIIKEYQSLKGIQLQGNEFKPVQQTIKTMFLSGRKTEDILACMRFFANNPKECWQNWTINTVFKQLPLFLSGKL